MSPGSLHAPTWALALALALAACGDAAQEDPGIATAVALERAFGRVADRVHPSVVGVTAYRALPEGAESPAPDERAGWQQAGARRHPGHEPVRTRSGFVVSADGYLLTSHHGVQLEGGRPADLIEVEFADQRVELARLVGGEPTLDLAVLKVDVARELDVAPLADPAVELRTGQWAIALADPPGPERTFAAGTIGAPPSRECYQEELTATLIQSSVRIPAEAWGGPLVDIHGDVIGVNLPRAPTALPEVVALGSSHALPIGLALTLYEPLVVRERSHSPWLGISVLPPRREWRLAQQQRDRPDRGVLIDDVFDPGPASRAGIQVGDVLVELGDEPVGSVGDFQRQLYLLGVGARAQAVVLRGDQTLRRRVEIEARPPEATQR